eukprot:375850-Hanusia_phi.AAC.1
MQRLGTEEGKDPVVKEHRTVLLRQPLAAVSCDAAGPGLDPVRTPRRMVVSYLSTEELKGLVPPPCRP